MSLECLCLLVKRVYFIINLSGCTKWGADQMGGRLSAENFKRPKNREDGSDLDDFLTESIASMQTIISEIFARRCRTNLRENFAKLREKLAMETQECSKSALHL